MRISHDNNFLFTASKDGTMMMFEIKDKDMLRGGAGRKFEGIANFSEEILTEKTEMDQYEQLIDTLQNELNQAKDPSQVGSDEKMSTKE
jgi:hypothetical protein